MYAPCGTGRSRALSAITTYLAAQGVRGTTGGAGGIAVTMSMDLGYTTTDLVPNKTTLPQAIRLAFASDQ